MNSYWLPNVIPLIFPITVIPTNPYYIPYQLPITMPTNLIPIIIPFLVLLYSPTSQTTHTQRTPPPRPHWSRPPRRQTRPPTWRTTLGAAWDRVHNGQAKQKKTSKNGELTMKQLVILPWKMGFNPKKMYMNQQTWWFYQQEFGFHTFKNQTKGEFNQIKVELNQEKWGVHPNRIWLAKIITSPGGCKVVGAQNLPFSVGNPSKPSWA